ncbi:hypothetical protein DH2020_017270 [Rehmannia glutinosa]|uniref:arogenate dehydratase n=1 Tax=Rehmannia glutinosa TaxID=99300 RepID=A0ABR0WUM8_REHGL
MRRSAAGHHRAVGNYRVSWRWDDLDYAINSWPICGGLRKDEIGLGLSTGRLPPASGVQWLWMSIRGCVKKKKCLLKAAPFLGFGADNKKTDPHSQLGFSDFVSRRVSFLNLRIQREGEYLSHRAIIPVEDEIPSSPGVVDEPTQITPAAGFHKDLNSLPKPLSATNLPSSSSDGTKVRVAYRGVPGSYSEAAALKAYPKCETVPCDEFEAVFKAVELWLVDKAILPIENSVGGSIHRNYDLLLRHRLHIVGEVQFIVNHCLLGLPGVRKEELKCVLSHPQALDQCEMFLNKLGVTRISADDTAGAAQVTLTSGQIVASEGVRETGAIASARAAEIYGLNVLAERIQTSIVFTLEEGPGVLFKALAVFAMRDINLSKIESRPQRWRPLRVVDDSNSGSAT